MNIVVILTCDFKNKIFIFSPNNAEYGILMPSECEKYLLDNDDDPHYWSGIDGSLYLVNDEKFYKNDEYCVDYFYMKHDHDDTEEIKV
jgi:hypothetical protein